VFPVAAVLGSLLLSIAFSFSLSCTRTPDPNTAFDRAWDTFQSGDLINAQSEATAGYTRFHSLSNDWAWKFAILNARILYRRGLYREGLKLLDSETAGIPGDEIGVKRLWIQGLLHTSMHEFRNAEQELSAADSLCAGTLYLTCEDVSTARGNLEMEQGHFERAQAFFLQVLLQARSTHDDIGEASALLDLSHFADEQEHFDQALEWAADARRIAASHHHDGIAITALGNMGWAFYKLGDLEKAESMFTDAKNQASRLGMQSAQIGWLTNLGYVEMDVSNAQVAEQSFLESLALAREIQSREDIINSLIALAFLSEQTNNVPDATRYADEALSMARADGNKRDETYPRLVQGRIAARQHDAATAEAAFHEVENSPDSPVFLKWEAEHSLARLYEDENQPDKAAAEYRTALTTFESARSELQKENSRLPFLTNATRIYDDYIHLLVAQDKSDEALQVAEFSRARTLSEGLGVLKKGTTFHPDPLNTRQLARTAGGNILFYWLGEKQSYLWLITPQKTTLYPLPPASEINAALERYRKALLGPQDVLETGNTEGFALYRMLIEPAKSPLSNNAKLFIIPDGPLNTLNFETLLVPDPTPHYWIEDVTIADASSLHLLAASRNAHKPAESLLLLGNAIAPNPDYPELRKAAAEMDSIEKHFPAAEDHAFSREHATPVAYLSSKPDQFSYIHFVAHGTASRISPLDSAIVLSKATAEDDSFKLYARDIIQHPLNAKLVTISTCYGAGSRAYSGEGLVGLSWAFLRAGAHNVIGALWEVSDVSTPQLMDDLYAGLKKGQSPDSALRAAKLSLLHSKTAFRKPFYWAPFQLYTRS